MGESNLAVMQARVEWQNKARTAEKEEMGKSKDEQ